MNRPAVFLGIDGGASNTTAVVADVSGRVLGVGCSGPVDHLYRREGRRQTRKALEEAVRGATAKAHLRGPVQAAVAGLTGLEPSSLEAVRAARMLRDVVRAEVVRVTWDVEIAFTGATAGGTGVMVIAGTGSVAFGKNAAGQTVRAGGYGYLIDDAGGGVSIGQAALRAALRARDGRGPQTALMDIFEARLGNWSAIRQRLYGEGGGRVLLAAMVPMVKLAARRGDPVARAILEDAGRALGELAANVATRLGMTRDPFRLYPVGGIFRMGGLVMEPMLAVLRKQALRCKIRRPALAPAVGAVLMAMEVAGVPISRDILRQLAASSRASSL